MEMKDRAKINSTKIKKLFNILFFCLFLFVPSLTIQSTHGWVELSKVGVHTVQLLAESHRGPAWGVRDRAGLRKMSPYVAWDSGQGEDSVHKEDTSNIAEGQPRCQKPSRVRRATVGL